MLQPDHYQEQQQQQGDGGSSASLASGGSPSTDPTLPLRGNEPRRPSSSAAGRVTPTQPPTESLPPPAKPSGRRPSASSMQATSPPVLAEVVYDDLAEAGASLPQAAPVAAAVRHGSRTASFEMERGRSRSQSRSPPPPSSGGSSSSSHSHSHSHRGSSSTRRLDSKHHSHMGRSTRSTRSTRSRSRSRSQSHRGGSGRGAVAREAVGSWWRVAKTSRKFKWGMGLFITGLILCTVAGLVDILGRAYRHAKIREAVVVDSYDHPEYEAWVGGSQIKTPVFWSYSFYNITNPSQFLLGLPPVVQEVGPFTFQMRNRKYNVTFSDRGRLVTYIQLTQHDYVGEPKDLSQAIYSFNLPYSVAVHTAGSESNLLKLGSQQALAELLFQMQAYFMPTLKENAVVTAIQTAVKALQDAFDTMQQPADAVAIRWGGGCTSNIFGKICGFSTMAQFLQAMDRKNKMDLNLLQLCINTKLTEAQAIPLAKVKAIWNPNDPYSMLNIDRFNASVRYGISYWLWGDADVVDTITSRFGINHQQFYILRSYLLSIYKSPMLESEVVKIFIESLPEEERGFAEIGKWSDFMWRQWAVGDVITRLQNKSMANPESMQPELPPEFAWYAESQGVETFQYGGKRWNRTQARCMFDLAERPMMFFQTEILNLPGPRINRPTFVDFGFEDGDQAQVDPKACFPSSKDWELMHGYLGYLAQYFVAPELQKMVLGNNGGLITKRTIYESLYGYAAPILQLSLAKDDPRAMRFAMLANDPSLEGPGLCLTSNDVENPYTACKFASINRTTNDDGMVVSQRLFNKVPNTFHTGKDDDARAGAFYTYHGDRNLAHIWPGGTIPFAGALKSRPGSVQYGYSDGMQFPPFDAINKPNASLSVFVPGFVLPIHFNFDQDVVVQGVKLKRFRMAPDTFSSSRADAKTFGMDQIQQDGLFNLTDLMVAATYFSKPHARPTPASWGMADIKGVRDFDPSVDDSYIDVEPTTGKTMNANIQLQLSAGVTPSAFDAFHKTVYPARVLPVLIARQHASVVEEDAKFFKTMVYGTEKLIFLTVVVSACVGAFLLVVGLSLVLFQALSGNDAALERVASGGGSSKELGGATGIKGADAGGVLAAEEGLGLGHARGGSVEMMRHTSSRSTVSGGGSPPPKPPARRESQR